MTIDKVVPLASRILGVGPPLVVLHGVFGSGDNWGTFIRPFAERYQVHLVDARNHGRSPHALPMDYGTLAADVDAYMDSHGLASADVIGHSMGGKLAMWLAWQYPGRVRRLAVIDIAPKAYAPHHHREMEGQQAVDPPTLTNRAQAEERMAAYVGNPTVRQFLLKNLGRTDAGTFAWKHNLEALAANITDVGEALPARAAITCPLIFVRGADSDYISVLDEHDIAARFSQATIATIEDASHWVHAQQPEALQRVLEAFFNKG